MTQTEFFLTLLLVSNAAFSGLCVLAMREHVRKLHKQVQGLQGRCDSAQRQLNAFRIYGGAKMMKENFERVQASITAENSIVDKGDASPGCCAPSALGTPYAGDPNAGKFYAGDCSWEPPHATPPHCNE